MCSRVVLPVMIHKLHHADMLSGSPWASCHITSTPVHLCRPSRHMSPQHIAITSHQITSHHITSHHITTHCHHITSHHITSHHIASHHITSTRVRHCRPSPSLQASPSSSPRTRPPIRLLCTLHPNCPSTSTLCRPLSTTPSQKAGQM